MKPDIKLIKQRKQLYGNNFTDIAHKWSTYTDTEISEEDVCQLMADMKYTRMEATQRKIDELKPRFEELYEACDWSTEFQVLCNKLCKLHESLIDSKLDRECYLWISNNWQEYLEL